MLKDLDILTTAMKEVGFTLVHSEAGTMDSGSAEFSNGKTRLKIGKDRSQWMFDGSRKELEPLGLWRLSMIRTSFAMHSWNTSREKWPNPQFNRTRVTTARGG